MRKYIKLNFVILIFIVLISAAILIVACERNEEFPITKHPDYIESYTINYIYPDIGGYYIDGDRNQHVKPGCDGKEVTVKAFEGFRFVEWSDGVKTISRRETNVQSSMELTPIFARIELSVKFNAEEGGYIEGETNQTVLYGDSSIEVKAVPDENHLFAGWSDGIMSETRIFTETKEDYEINALFVSKTKTMRYDFDIPSVYHNEITLTHGNLEATKFYIPEKQGYIFDGWYINKELTKKVTDGRGYYFRGNTIFYDKSDTLYPKWITEINQTFKLLLAFIENVDAQLPTKENELVDIDYKMTREERVVCELIPGQISDKLNTWFDGSVVFEVDTFYVSSTIGNEAYHAGLSSTGMFSYSSFADNVSQLHPILKDYRSIITTGSMNDFERKLNNSSGTAGEKFAYVVFEHLQSTFKNYSIHEFIELNPLIWETQIDTYLHEFAHTVENAILAYDFHKVIEHYWLKIDHFDVIRLYLLNQAEIDGEIVGIPMSFWKGDTNVKVSYVTSDENNGWDKGKIIPLNMDYDSKYNSFSYYIPFGFDIYVEAIPVEGWRFVKWSDGITTPIRHDTNIISRILVYAIFEKIE